MNEPKKTSGAAAVSSISEAERMAQIRELLVGPAIADESERVDKSFDRLSDLAKEQAETISALQARIQALEERQHADMRNHQTRLLGMMEVLLASEDEVRSRLKQHEALWSRLEDGNKGGGA